jgi:nucleoside diphosphate kinase
MVGPLMSWQAVKNSVAISRIFTGASNVQEAVKNSVAGPFSYKSTFTMGIQDPLQIV